LVESPKPEFGLITAPEKWEPNEARVGEGEKENCGDNELLSFRGHVLWSFAETLWLRPDLLWQVGSAARLIEKGVVCWLHWIRGLLREKPIRRFREGREVLAGWTE